MPSDILAAADAVVEAINASGLLATFPGALPAVRAYVPQYDLQDMGVLHVTVAPKGIVESIGSRSVLQYDLSVDVAVQRKAQAGDAVDLDPLLDLVVALADFFRLRRLGPYPDAVWVSTEHLALFDPEHLTNLRQFTSVLTLTFRVIR